MFQVLIKLQVNEATGNERCQEHCWSRSCSKGKHWETAQILGLAPQLHISEHSTIIRHKDKTVSFHLTDARNEPAKVCTTTEISDKLEGGKIASVCEGKQRPCFALSDARRTGWPMRAFDWSEHFSPEVPAASSWGPRTSSSRSFKPRTHTALIDEDKAAGKGVQEPRWQSPAWWGHTAGQRYREWESIGWAQREGESYKWFLLWAKYSIRRSDKVLRLLAAFVFSGSAQCLSSSYRRRSRTRWAKRSGSRSERSFSSSPTIN